MRNTLYDLWDVDRFGLCLFLGFIPVVVITMVTSGFWAGLSGVAVLAWWFMYLMANLQLRKTEIMLDNRTELLQLSMEVNARLVNQVNELKGEAK